MNTQNSKNAKPLFWFSGSPAKYARYLTRERGVRESSYRYEPTVRASSGTAREQAGDIVEAMELDERIGAAQATSRPVPQPAEEPDVDRVEFGEDPAEPVEELVEIYQPRDQKLLTLLKESTDQIRAAAENFEQFYVDYVPVPSAMGYDLKAAGNVFKRSGLKIGTVAQEYSETVPEGHVISHVPAAGGQAAKNAAVKVVISKGKAPASQKHDRVKQRDTVRMHRGDGRDDDGPVLKLRLVNLAQPGASQIIRALGAANIAIID